MKKSLVSFALLFVFAASLRAQSPIITYQGAVSGPNGSSLHDSTYPITVTLWTDSTGGTALWHDVFETAVKGGIFNIVLGSQAPLPAPATMDRPLWLGVSFNGGAEARSPIGAVPMALNVADSSVTTAKLADHSVTGSKIGTEYIPYIRVNGTKVNSGRNSINFTGSDGLSVDFDSSSYSLIIHLDSGNALTNIGKGAKPQWVAPNLCGTNHADSIESNSVLAGCSNYVSDTAYYSAIMAGTNSTVYNSNSVVGSGRDNVIGQHELLGSDGDDYSSAIVTGDTNSIEEGWGFIGGGGQNTIGLRAPATGDASYYASITGGYGNTVDSSAVYSSITGGYKNKVSDSYNGLVGGSYNKILVGAELSFLGSGDSNFVESGNYEAITAGHANRITGFSFLGGNFIGAGTGNKQSGGDGDVIGGGDTNTTVGSLNAIIGGAQNYTTGKYSTAAGGLSNIISGDYSAIPGGRNLTLGTWSFGYNSGGATDVSANSSIGYFGNVNLWLGNVDSTARALRFYSPNNSSTYTGAHFSSFQAGTQSTNIIYTLPVSLPDSVGRVLGVSGITGSDVNLAWISSGSGGGGGLFWGLTGNANTVAGTNFLGTTDSAAFEIHVLDTGVSTGGNKRVMRYSEGSTSPNILGGSSANFLGVRLSGAAILSGGSTASPNHIDSLSSFSVIAGEGNSIADSSDHSVISGGQSNSIADHSDHSVISGGQNNRITNVSDHCFIGGGQNNSLRTPSWGTLVGGWQNDVGPNGWATMLGGGDSNIVLYSLSYLGGGWHNKIGDSVSSGWGYYGDVLSGGGYNYIDRGAYSAIISGYQDTNRSNFAFMGSGVSNKIDGSSDTSVLVGGADNYVTGTYSALVGGHADTITSTLSIIVGGCFNKVQATKWGTIVGGCGNKVTDTFAFIGGGADNSASSYAGVIAGGTWNVLSDSAAYSSIGGGFTNTLIPLSRGFVIHLASGELFDTFPTLGFSAIAGGGLNHVNSSRAFIGGGQQNTVDTNGVGSVIAGGFENGVKSALGTISGGFLDTVSGAGAFVGGGYQNTALGEASVIAGGLSNHDSAGGGSIGGGNGNTITSAGTDAAIPGGSGLTANAFAQTVVGRSNVPNSGDLLIVGNGNPGLTTSNAFEVTTPGASIVHDMDSNRDAPPASNTNGKRPFPTYGGRYLDNTTVAEGDITSWPVPIPGAVNNFNTNADFGVVAAFHPHIGEFIICIRCVDAQQQPVSLVNGFITATLKDADNNVNDSTLTCGTITATNLQPFATLPAPYSGYFIGPGAPPTPSAWFIIRVSGPTECGPLDRQFDFKICARPW